MALNRYFARFPIVPGFYPIPLSAKLPQPDMIASHLIISAPEIGLLDRVIHPIRGRGRQLIVVPAPDDIANPVGFEPAPGLGHIAAKECINLALAGVDVCSI